MRRGKWDALINSLEATGLLQRVPLQPKLIEGYSEHQANVYGVNVLMTSRIPREIHCVVPSGLSRQGFEMHALVRDYFASRFRKERLKVWIAAHARLFQHLNCSVPYWPVCLDGLEQLYRAVAHGVKRVNTLRR